LHGQIAAAMQSCQQARKRIWMVKKVKVAIVGPGNIGIDLMEKIRSRGRAIELACMAGLYADSEGILRAAGYGVKTETEGLDPILADPEIRIVFEATSAGAHRQHAPLYQAAGKLVIDLTPAAVGPYVVPVVNLDEHLEADNINLVTCGGQATVPIVAAIGQVQPVLYAETISTIASRSAGPGTRANIDEFTATTARALQVIGGARTSKAIIILNPAQPPILMRNTIYCRLEGPADLDAIRASVGEMVSKLQAYVPGYELIMPPTLDGDRLVTMIQVRGAGDYLPVYAGNLDIITCAAVEIAERLASRILAGGTMPQAAQAAQTAQSALAASAAVKE
jgi:acetaldehyde dehydrogenase